MRLAALALRPFDDSRWDEVLAFADAVVPYDLEGNRVWLTNRQRFAATGRVRRHYAALREDGQMIAYGAIEQQADDTVYRLFIVPRAAGLMDTVGQALFERFAEDLDELGATHVWMREYARDVELVQFAQEYGFVQVEAFDLPGPTGTLNTVRLEKRL
jgi:N-acetylglutamate synthase-like GNAT family acetyltransferase